MKNLLLIGAVGFGVYAFLQHRRNQTQVSQNTINFAYPNGTPSTQNPYLDMSQYVGLPFTGINFTS